MAVKFPYFKGTTTFTISTEQKHWKIYYNNHLQTVLLDENSNLENDKELHENSDER